jgi:hypothetical protein
MLRRVMLVALLAAVLLLALAIPALADSNQVQSYVGSNSDQEAWANFDQGTVLTDEVSGGFLMDVNTYNPAGNEPASSSGYLTVLAFSDISLAQHQNVGMSPVFGQAVDPSLFTMDKKLNEGHFGPYDVTFNILTWTDNPYTSNWQTAPGTVTVDWSGQGDALKGTGMTKFFDPVAKHWFDHGVISTHFIERFQVATFTFDCPSLGYHKVVTTQFSDDPNATPNEWARLSSDTGHDATFFRGGGA